MRNAVSARTSRWALTVEELGANLADEAKIRRIDQIESHAFGSIILGVDASRMILFITRKHPPSVGGMQQLSYSLTTEVARRRKAEIISWGGSQRLLPAFLAWAFVRALFVMLHGQVEVIHVGDPVLAPLGLVLKWMFRRPVVVTVHGLDVTYPNRLYQLLIPWFLTRVDAVIAISRQASAECLARGVPAGKCRIVLVGIDPDVPIALSTDTARNILERHLGVSLGKSQLILTTGRLVPRKGVARFVDRTLPVILANRPDVRYVIVGDGPERGRIRQTIERRGVRDKVALLGQTDRTVLWAAYQACDLFVMPNVPVAGDVEGFGIVALEACIAQRCVVASDLEGIRDAIVDGRTGVLVAPDDPSAQAKVIIDLLAQDEKRNAIGQQARDYVRETFGWSRIAEQYLAVFDEVRDRGERSRPTSTHLERSN